MSQLLPQDVAALTACADRDASLIMSSDWETAASGYAADAVRMPPNAPPIRGREAICQSFDVMPPISAFEFRMIDLQGDGEIAYMQAAWSITVEPHGIAEPVTDSGKILIVFRKQPDGSWLRVADAWNSDSPSA